MESATLTGTKRMIEGRWRVFYDGYWIKLYEPPADSLNAKKSLIQALTRRLFNHVEHGLNIPGTRLEEARRAFEAEADPQRKRVKGGMLAGALFNRAADVFQKVVELQSLGVHIGHDNALMQQCGSHLQEALTLGRMVLHRSGEEGIDELWGEPFKAFAFPIEEFYRSRYLKIAQAMHAIDQIAVQLASTLEGQHDFHRPAAAGARFRRRGEVEMRDLAHRRGHLRCVVVIRGIGRAPLRVQAAAVGRSQPGRIAAGGRRRAAGAHGQGFNLGHDPRARLDAQEHAGVHQPL